MKKTLIGLMLALLAAGLILAPASGQTVKDVLDKMIQAQGGRKALEAIKDTTTTGSFEMVQMGMSGSMTMYNKEPNLMRMDMEAQGYLITQAFDGQTAWATNPMTSATEVMSEQQALYFKRGALGNASLFAPETLGITYELKGTEKVNDKDYIVALQKQADGYTMTFYLDPQTYLTYKSKGKSLDMMGGEVDGETVMEDYQTTDGIPSPRSLTIYQNGVEFIRIKISSVKFNSGLEDSLFKMKQ
jgi:outer membrane lipoprotein-sorting protein